METEDSQKVSHVTSDPSHEENVRKEMEALRLRVVYQVMLDTLPTRLPN